MKISSYKLGPFQGLGLQHSSNQFLYWFVTKVKNTVLYITMHGILYFGDQKRRSNGSITLKIENLATKGLTNVVAIVKI